MKNIYITLLFLIIILIAIFYFINSFNTKSDFNSNDLFNNNEIGLNGKIRIDSDEYGLKTVALENSDDFYFALGVMHAKDRLWQIDYLRRRAEGRLSEVLGEEYIHFDKFIKCFNINQIAENQYNILPSNTRININNYAKGINYFLDKQSNNLSIEFNYLGYKPEKWTGSDCISLLLLYSLEQSEKLPNEIKKYKLNTINFENVIDSLNKSINYKKNQNNLIKSQQLENTFQYFGLISNINQDYSWEIFSDNITDSIKKSTSKLNYFSFIKNDNLKAINQYYPIKFIKNKEINFHFTLPGIPLSNLSIINQDNKLRTYNFNEYFKGIFDFELNNRTISNNNISHNFNNTIDTNIKINYEIDTLKVKDKSKIQFYKRYISHSKSQNIKYNNLNDNFYLVSDYLLDNKNGKLNILDYSNEKKGLDFYFQFKIGENNLSNINNLFDKFDKINFNPESSKSLDLKSIKELREEVLNQNTLNANSLNNTNDIYSELLSQRELINDEIKLSKSLLINSQISDVMLQQNLTESELDKKLLSLIKQVYYSNLNYFSNEEKDFIDNLIIKNSTKFSLFKKFGLDKISKDKSKTKLIQTLLVDKFKNNLYFQFFKSNSDGNNKFIKDELFKHKTAKNNFIKIIFSSLDSNKSNANLNYKFNLINLENAKTKLISSIKKSIYDLDNIKYNNHLVIANPIGRKNLLKYNSIQNSLKIGSFSSLKFAQNQNIFGQNIASGQSYKCILDYNNFTLYYVVFGGISGDLNNFHYKDQNILWEKGGYCKVNLSK